MHKKKRDKFGQMQISFGMIFSILLIVIFVVFAFFGIKKFMDVQNTILVNKFIDDLDNDVEKMWESSRGSQEVSYILPKKIQEVCFKEDNKENVYFISKEDFDGGRIGYVNYESTLEGEEETCFNVENKKVSFVIDKTYGEDSVTISKEGRDTEKNYGSGGSGSSSGGNNGEGISGDMVIVYYNNFEQNTPGTDDYKEDWNACHPNPNVRIKQDSQQGVVFSENFKKGEVSLSHITGAGFACYYYFDKGFDELYFSYKVKFENGFDAGKGGKLPRIESKGAIAGECPTGTDGFTGGMMFSKDGDPFARFYVYHMDQWNSTFYRNMYYDQTPERPRRYPTSCEDSINVLGGSWGTSFNWVTPSYSCNWQEKDSCFTTDENGKRRETATLTTGEWHTITERVVPNTPGQANGFLEGYVDGKMVAQVTGLRFRTIEDIKLDFIDFTSFFGGGGADRASPKDQTIYFDDLIAYYYTNSDGSLNPTSTNLPEMSYPEESLTNGETLTIKGSSSNQDISSNHPNMFLNQQEIDSIKSKIDSEPWKSAYIRLISDANSKLSKSYYSVTKNGGSPNKNTYYARGPYAWRCGENPCGATCTGDEWVICDGKTNPNADREDYMEAIKVGSGVRNLALAYKLTDDPKYAEKAIYFINHWTIDSSTMMLPNYPNFQSKIELSITMPALFYGGDLLLEYPGWDEEDKQKFLEWSHDFGESALLWEEHNNFENWRTVVLFSVAVLTDDSDMLNYATENWKRLIPLHINGSGFMIKEIKRADSLSYSIYALSAMVQGAEIARHQNIDLYNYKDSRDIGLKNVLDTHAKYSANPSSWPLSQVNTYKGTDSALYEVAYRFYEESSYLGVINKWKRPMTDRCAMGPVTLTHSKDTF